MPRTIFTQGNILDADVEALVNTVNTVGVMGKGIALMFKEHFPNNMKAYAAACKIGEVMTGKMFATETGELLGAKWIINFPTKQHWRAKSKMEWIETGLIDLRRFIIDKGIRSIAIPPLGAGNGGLDWCDVKPKIEQALGNIDNVNIIIFEPTERYQNITQKTGVKKLTPARAMVAEMIRRYWILGNECSLLEIQKLTWFLHKCLTETNTHNPLKLQFQASQYGPYANQLDHLLNQLDGSYLRSDKRIADSAPLDVIAFDDTQKDYVAAYLRSDGSAYLLALEKTSQLIEGFESPYGMELLSTVDWLLTKQSCQPTVTSIKTGLANWPAGKRWAQRKLRLFKDGDIQVAINRLTAQ